MKAVHMITFILLVVGGLNWLVLGVFQTDLGMWLGGQDALISRIIYIVVGIAAVVELATHKKGCKSCEKKGDASPAPMSPGSVA